jgi:molybdopterin synthase sulfur carrier subunit
MKVLYFAWVRERVGKSDEIIAPPDEVRTAGEFIDWLAGRGEEYAYAFENPKLIRVAMDQAHVKHDALIAGAREIALFPPMTGG